MGWKGWVGAEYGPGGPTVDSLVWGKPYGHRLNPACVGRATNRHGGVQRPGKSRRARRSDRRAQRRAAVIFRRGPSRRVRMLKWNLRNDKIEPGQWIEAGVHVARCDISPNGELVACFVASHRRRPGTWTAISRPPLFTALAVWPKGDSWGGGGLFVSDHHFLLEHDERIHYGVDQFQLMADFTLPRRFRVQSYVGNAPVPECDIEQCRMVLSGWRFVQRAVWGRATSPIMERGLPFERPEIMARALDRAKSPRFELRRFVDGYAPGRAQGNSRIMRAEIHDLTNATDRDLGRVDWVDVDHAGDVLWSARGKLFRLAGPTRPRHGHRGRAEARRRPQRHGLRGDRGAPPRAGVA